MHETAVMVRTDERPKVPPRGNFPIAILAWLKCSC
jgi:hypothetical protein